MIFENQEWKRNQVIFEKDFEIRNQKDLILKINDLANKKFKTYDSDIKPFSTEKETHLKC